MISSIPTGSQSEMYDFVIIGSGFGGSVSAMRLTEKGYRVMVLERGKRYRDQDFAKYNWDLPKYLWLPILRCFGIFEMSFLNGLLALHGSGVGGGSLTYANVLMEPDDRLFSAPAWSDLADWKQVLRPHYDVARKMLGVAQNPKLWPADHILKDIAKELGHEHTFSASDVGVFFGDPAREGEVVPDPFFGGEGPERTSCIHCGACMVGCRHNAKNTLVKNYLYFAEKWGAKIKPEVIVKDIRPLTDSQPDGARYEIIYSKSTAWIGNRTGNVKARSVIVSAGVLGTLGLLFRCREITRSLPKISSRLGDQVRTNSEAILGATSRDKTVEYSNGIAISSVFAADTVTRIEPVRFPAGSGFIRTLAAPLIEGGGHFFTRMVKSVIEIIKRPIDFVHYKFTADWARRTTVILVMQTEDNLTRIRLGRNLFTGWRRGLVLAHDNNTIPAEIPIGNQVTKEFARRVRGIAASAFTDSLFNFPTTAHILGGVPFGKSASDGVINLDCEVFNYPGLYVVDGSIMPANPGINPSLTITALSEYAMSLIVPKEGHEFGEILVAQPVKTQASGG